MSAHYRSTLWAILCGAIRGAKLSWGMNYRHHLNRCPNRKARHE